MYLPNTNFNVTPCKPQKLNISLTLWHCRIPVNRATYRTQIPQFQNFQKFRQIWSLVALVLDTRKLRDDCVFMKVRKLPRILLKTQGVSSFLWFQSIICIQWINPLKTKFQTLICWRRNWARHVACNLVQRLRPFGNYAHFSTAEPQIIEPVSKDSEPFKYRGVSPTSTLNAFKPWNLLNSLPAALNQLIADFLGVST